MFHHRPFRTLSMLLLLIIGCLAIAGSRPLGEAGQPADKTLSPYFLVVGDEPGKDVMPLKSSRADMKIAGLVAEVKVTQV